MNKINNYFPITIVWLALTSTAPFIFFSWPGHPYKILTLMCLLMMVFFMAINKDKRVLKDLNLIIITIIPIIYYVILSSILNQYNYLNYCVQYIALFIIINYIDNFIGFRNFAKSYIIIISAMGIGGAATFFMHIFIGINPIFEVKYSALGTTYFLGLTSTNDYYNLEGLRMMRFAGFFDEPGAFALYAMFAIFINKIYFDNKLVEKILTFVTIFTFSLAYFFIIPLYYLFFYFKRKYLKYIPILIAILIAITTYLNTYTGDNKNIILVQEMTVKRFEIEDGKLTGNNRYEAEQNDKKLFIDNPLFGTPNKEDVRNNNVYSIVAEHGLLGSLFYYIFLVYLLVLIFTQKKGQSSSLIKIFILISLNFFHRPDFSSVFILLIIYTQARYLIAEEIEPNNALYKISPTHQNYKLTC